MKTTARIDSRHFLIGGLIFLFCLSLAALTNQLLFIAFPFLLLALIAGWQFREALFLALLFSLPFSVEYSFSNSLGTDLPDEPLMWLTSFIVIGSVLYNPYSLKEKYLLHPLSVLLIILLMWTVVAVLFSLEPVVSIKFLLAKGWYLLSFVAGSFIFLQTKDVIEKAVLVVTSAMIIVVLIVLYRHSQTGFSFATINDALTPFFRNHVNYSAMLVCFVPVLIAFRAKYKSHPWLGKLFLFLALIFIVAVFLSYARGAWLALAAGGVAYLLIRKKLLFAGYILSVVIVLTAFFWLKHNDRYLQYAHDFKTTIFHKNFNEHLIATYRLKDVSTAERFYRWIAGVRMIKDNPVTGSGPGTFHPHYKEYAIPAFKTWVSDNKDHSTVHNYFLLLAIEQGLPGLFFFLLLAGAMLLFAQRIYHSSPDPFHKSVGMLTGVILIMILIVNFLSDLIETDKTGSLFFICLSFLIITSVKIKTAAKEEN
mgnify:CR=1 FL=1